MRFLALALAALCAYAAEDFDVVYRKVDGVDLRMDIAIPESPGSHPAVVCLHGGGWSMGSRRSFHKTMRELAANGFVAASVQYRLAPVAHHPAQVEDIQDAIAFLRRNATRYRIDQERVVLMGASAGAHLALVTGLPQSAGPAGIRAIIDISGPTDLRDWRMSESADRVLRQTTGKSSEDLLTELLGSTERSGKLVKSASPVTLVHAKSPPVLIFQWRNDQAVAAEQVDRLTAALASATVQHEVVWFEGRGHALNGPGVESIVPRTVSFLRSLFALPHPRLHSPGPFELTLGANTGQRPSRERSGSGFRYTEPRWPLGTGGF
jgi:acetyl esterase/lipase